MLPDRLTLCFHGVGRPGRPLEPGEARCWLEVSQFARILDEVVDAPDVAITFDDGNKSDAAVALDLLRERGLTATFFVIASRIDTTGSLSAEDLHTLADHGMTLGTHGYAHRPWRRLTTAARERELVEARSLIEAASDQRITEAACPFGAYDRGSLRALRDLGYQRVYTVDGGWADSDSWLQTRHSVHDDDDARSVRALIAEPRRVGLADALGTAKRLVKRWR